MAIHIDLACHLPQLNIVETFVLGKKKKNYKQQHKKNKQRVQLFAQL